MTQACLVVSISEHPKFSPRIQMEPRFWSTHGVVFQNLDLGVEALTFEDILKLSQDYEEFIRSPKTWEPMRQIWREYRSELLTAAIQAGLIQPTKKEISR